MLLELDEYVVISNSQRTANILSGKCRQDIDLLVTGPAWRNAQRRLLDAGFRVEIKLSAPHKALFFDYARDENHILMLDVYRQYFQPYGNRWICVRPSIIRQVIEESIPDARGLRHANPKHRMLFVLLGMILKGNPHSQYADEINVQPDAVADLETHLADNYGIARDTAETMCNWLRWGKPPVPAHIEKFLNAVCIRRGRLPTLLAWCLKMPVTASHVLARTAPTVAIVGLDGAGKSTLSAALERRFSTKAKSMYWASRSMLLPTTRLYRFIERKLLKTDVRRTDIPEQRTMPGGKSRPLGWTALYKLPILAALNANKYAEYLAKYALLRIHRLRGCVTITDRYVCDEEFEYGNRFYHINRWLYRHAYPKPDILVIATARPETIHTRKPTIPVETDEHYQDAYRRIAAEYARKGVHVIEASSDDSTVEENVNRIVEAVFSRRVTK